ncbi:DUF6671 family protein [Flavobacterium sp.]|uniref:DUF6671 family protein n=1 Tax=Flavobacterium sp. TaxID=239 RepID=UPI0038CF50DE
MYKGRRLLIATKHNKEKVIAPIFEKKLEVQCFVTNNFDTDELGTFSGEIERKDDAFTTLKKKCEIAMKANNCDLAIASEGSFGMHPSLFFAPADDELLLFIDAKNNIEVIAREISIDTNFNASELNNEEELFAFAEKSNFPSHGLILRPSKNNTNDIYKGITDRNELLNTFNKLINQYGSVYIETDMRASFNPKRMKVIENVAIKLVESIESKCPNCDFPGFSVSKVNTGLKCGWCNNPTKSTLSYSYKCKKCHFQKEELFPNNKTIEDPAYCDFCNP